MCPTKLVWFLISKYFVNLTSVLVVYNSSISSEVHEFYLNETVDSFRNVSLQGHPILLQWINLANVEKASDLNSLILQHIDLRVEGFITILSNLVEDFLKARLYASEHSILRLKDKYYLFLSENESPGKVLSNEILNLYPHHLFVSATRNCNTFELWTQQFVGEENNTDAVHLETFYRNGSFEKNVNLFPNKLRNLQRRTLAVASVTYIPYVNSFPVAEGSGDLDSLDPKQPKKSVTYTGIEADIVLSFCRLRNCVLKVMPYGSDNWGEINENGSSDGMLGSVYRKETELGIGCSYNWYNELFETSIAIGKSAVRILAPAPSRYPAYMTIILPFNKFIWSLIILSIILGSLVMHVIKYFAFKMDHRFYRLESNFEHTTSYELTLFQIIAIFFQQSFSQSKLDRFAARMFLTTLLMAGLTLENTYSGQLKSLLTIPIYTDPVDTIHKFAATDWKWATPSVAWIFSIAYSDIPHEQVMSEKFVELSYEEIKNASYLGNIGIGIERLHGGSYNFGNFVRDDALDQMIITKDDLYYDWSRAFSIRGWPLMDELNTFILWCSEHGIYAYWERMYVAKFLDKKIQDIIQSLAAGHIKKFAPMTLTVANISGPLFALFIGYSTAFIVLLVEVFADHIKRLIHS